MWSLLSKSNLIYHFLQNIITSATNTYYFKLYKKINEYHFLKNISIISIFNWIDEVVLLNEFINWIFITPNDIPLRPVYSAVSYDCDRPMLCSTQGPSSLSATMDVHGLLPVTAWAAPWQDVAYWSVRSYAISHLWVSRTSQPIHARRVLAWRPHAETQQLWWDNIAAGAGTRTNHNVMATLFSFFVVRRCSKKYCNLTPEMLNWQYEWLCINSNLSLTINIISINLISHIRMY